MDFFTTEVLTLKGLTTYYVLFFIHQNVPGCTDKVLPGDRSETGRIHAVRGSGVDGAAGAQHDDGGVRKPERLSLSAA